MARVAAYASWLSRRAMAAYSSAVGKEFEAANTCYEAGATPLDKVRRRMSFGCFLRGLNGLLVALAGPHISSQFTLVLSVPVVIIALALNDFGDAHYTLTLVIVGGVGLIACAVLTLAVAGLPSWLPRSCRTYSLSSLLFCAGLLGWQALALLTRMVISVDHLRVSTAGVRADGALLPPFANVGVMFLILGANLGFQPLPLLRRLQVVLLELALFTVGMVIVYLRTEEEDIFTLWVPYHCSAFVLGLLLALLAKGELSSSAHGRAVGLTRCTTMQLERQAELDPSRERANRLLALVVALVVYPLALKVTLAIGQLSNSLMFASLD